MSAVNSEGDVTHKRVECIGGDTFLCACGISYKRLSSLSSHIESKTQTLKCPHCSKCLSRTGLLYHMQNRVCQKDIISHDLERNTIMSSNSSRDTEHTTTSSSIISLSTRG